MHDWLYGIGEWVVINENVRLGSPSDVGRLAYIKELLTDKYYNYRVCTYKNTEINVRESELNPIPKDKLDYYLKVSKWKKVKPKQYNDECKIVKLDFLSEKAYLENRWGLKYTLAFKEIEEIKGDGEMESKVVDNVTNPKELSNKELHKNLLNEIHDTYVKKNADYGNSFEEQYKEYGLLSALIRFDDKIKRLKQLNKHDAQVKDESIRDSALDLANYAIMTVMELDKTKLI